MSVRPYRAVARSLALLHPLLATCAPADSTAPYDVE